MVTMTRVAMRHAMALFAGLCLVSAFFYGLQGMIAKPQVDWISYTAHPIDFTPKRLDTPVETTRGVKPTMGITRHPEAPPINTNNNPGDQDRVIIDNPVVSSNATIPIDREVLTRHEGNFSGTEARDVTPLIRIEPQYPVAAAQQGIEGWVQVRFDISALGTVTNAKVVNAKPAGVFNEAAVNAVMRWRYNPKIEAGTKVDRRGVDVLLRFNLDQN